MHHHGFMPDDRVYRVCFVCSGNICRSPMSEVVLRRMADEAGISRQLVVDSAGTGDWHIGERADDRTLAALSDFGYDGATHRARQFDPQWFAHSDLVIALDRGHERTLRSWAPTLADRAKVRLLSSFDPATRDVGDVDIPDPYYDSDAAFRLVLHQIEAACQGLLDHIVVALADPADNATVG